MSFDTWYEAYPDEKEYAEGMEDAFNAGAAESEAQIAALQARILELERELDATKTAAKLLSTPASEEPSCCVVGCRIIGPHEHGSSIAQSASGEPARKP